MGGEEVQILLYSSGAMGGQGVQGQLLLVWVRRETAGGCCCISHSRRDDPGVVMARRRSGMASKAPSRGRGGRTTSQGCVFEGLCKYFHLLFV